MKLYKITMTAFKVFYVEAGSQKAAFDHHRTKEEASGTNGDVPFEHEETTAVEMDAERAAHIRKNYPDQVLDDED